jgi:hypothetical protein
MPPDEMDRPPEICEAWSDDYLQQPWLSACATRSPACAGPSAEGEEMAEAREASDVEALGEVMLIQGTMQRQFLRIVLRRLATDLPAFNAELLLAEIDLLRESLANGRERSALHTFALKEWERLSEMALDAIASTRAKPGRH